jgi:hypothetical protein
MKALFVDGPLAGQISEVVDTPGIQVPVRPQPRKFGQLFAEEEIVPSFTTVEYRRSDVCRQIVDNAVCRIYLTANLMISTDIKPSAVPVDQIEQVAEAHAETKPQHNILTNFDDWFDQFVFHANIPCRQRDRLANEVNRAFDELESIANRRQSNDDEPVRTPYEGATL